MSKIILTQGLPGSGKSYWAEEEIRASKGQILGITKDKLRDMVHGGYWNGDKTEQHILSLQELLLKQYISWGKDVIVHDTNFGQHIERISLICTNCEIIIKDFTKVPLQTCIDQDAKRSKKLRVGPGVIIGMYNKYLLPEGETLLDPKNFSVTEPSYVSWDITKENCYIFDIDGTLSLKGNRSPYDWDKVTLDIINTPVVMLQRKLRLYSPDYKMIIMSGRDSICRKKTKEWLHRNRIQYDQLYMRPQGDSRKDSVVKQEIYDQYIKNQYNVLGVFDDRLQVCKMWYELGLPLFRVGNPNSDF